MNDATGSLRIEREASAHAARIAPPNTLHVGGSPRADFVVVDDPQISFVHFRLEHHDGAWWVHDLESRNGTYVNGERVRETIVRDGDRIKAGATTFRIRLEARAPRADPQTDAPADTAAAMADAPGVARIVNTTPFTVGTAYSESVDGRAWLSIVVKATWTIEATPKAAATPLPIFTSDQFTSDDPAAPITFESDLVPFKPCADVVLVGRAHAREPVTELVAGLRVGKVRQAVAVVGDRVWEWQGMGSPTLSAPRPFRTMDLVYERAFGGIDGPAAMYCKENLVGTGFVGRATRERVDGLRLPNVEDRGNLITSWESRPKPVGFGFYGRGWMPRLGYAGTYDDTYTKTRHPLPPADFSYRFFNGAHPDLQVEGYLGGDEDVVLLNVCPGAPEMRFCLPGIVPKITVSRWKAPSDEWSTRDVNLHDPSAAELLLDHEVVTPVLDTLVFIPDKEVFYEVFRGVCRLSRIDSLEMARIAIAV